MDDGVGPLVQVAQRARDAQGQVDHVADGESWHASVPLVQRAPHQFLDQVSVGADVELPHTGRLVHPVELDYVGVPQLEQEVKFAGEYLQHGYPTLRRSGQLEIDVVEFLDGYLASHPVAEVHGTVRTPAEYLFRHADVCHEPRFWQDQTIIPSITQRKQVMAFRARIHFNAEGRGIPRIVSVQFE